MFLLRPESGYSGGLNSSLRTLVAETRSGGHHIYYALPPNASAKSGTNVLGPGIDIRSWGGLAVGPGSVINGRPYRWLNNRQIVLAPQWLIDEIGPPGARSPHAGEVLVDEDEEACDLAWKYIEHFGPIVREGGRNTATVAVANIAFEQGASEPTTIAYVHAWNVARCHPPLELEEIEATVRSAKSSRQLSDICIAELVDFVVAHLAALDEEDPPLVYARLMQVDRLAASSRERLEEAIETAKGLAANAS